MAADGWVVSCYEASRDGFWLHRWMLSQGIDNHVVISSRMDVNRRKRRRKTDQMDLRSLLRLMAHWIAGEEDVWRVLHVPPVEAEGRRRHLHRELKVLTDERAERTKRILGLLATQSVQLKLTEDYARWLEEVRLWDGSRLPPEPRGRLEREWVRRESVVEEIQIRPHGRGE